MKITKEELKTLIREDMVYQRKELTPSLDTVLNINGVVIYYDIFTRIKLIFDDHNLRFGLKRGGWSVNVVASVSYSEIISVGYLYNNKEKLEKRLSELRNN